MYQNHFRFEKYPFQNTPDPAFFFSSPTHREALAAMLYGVREGKGFILITGDVGTGKTTLVQALKAELGDQHVVIEINNPWVSHEDILNTIRGAVALTDTAQTETSRINALKSRLIELDARGRLVVLVIDEAHQLPERTLEGIRLISNIETPTRKLIQIVLLGQDELGAMLGRHSMRQIEQRIGLAFHLSKLSRADTEDYIRHRLRIARGSDALFPSESIDVLYPTSQGIPRIINHLCDFCLLTAYHKNAGFVDTETAREVTASLHPMQASASPARIPGPRAAAAHSSYPREPATHASPLPDLNAPREPAGSTLPPASFILPKAGERAHVMKRERAGVGGRYVLAALLLGMVGAAVIWFMQNGERSDLPPRANPGGQVGPSAHDSRAPESDTGEKFGLRSAPKADSKRAAAPAAVPGEIPFPVDPARVTRFEMVTVTPETDISIAVSRRYGAWNETVRDLVLGANPQLASLANLPANTVVRLPVLNREHMIVQGNRGEAFIYYASFGDEAVAKGYLETLKKIWSDAFIVTVRRKGVPVYRIYLGSYESVGTAESVVRSVWFKYLPNFN